MWMMPVVGLLVVPCEVYNCTQARKTLGGVLLRVSCFLQCVVDVCIVDVCIVDVLTLQCDQFDPY